MNNNKVKTLFLICGILLICSCYEDKGNYTYGEPTTITVENLPTSISLVQKSDHIVLDPVIISSKEGTIAADNPNFEYGCRLYLQAGSFPSGSRWVDINEQKTRKVDILADFDANSYLAWYTITDKRSGETKNVSVEIKITSGTYEGWMVLCDVGSENKTRLDMVSVLSKVRKEAVHDILGSGAPQLRNSNKILFDAWPKYAKGDAIWMSTQDGTYVLNQTTLQTKAVDNIATSLFILDLGDEIPVAVDALPFTAHFAVTNKGNLYYQNMGKTGSAFELPINMFKEDGAPEFKVAPFIGVPQMRPYTWDEIALFYDKDNKRFVGWDTAKGKGQICFNLPEPENKLFSYTTGRDLVTMVNTKFNDGTIYSVLQDAAQNRYVYGINLAGGQFAQTFYQQISTEGFSQADQFAFHSQYPYMFYSVGNKVYCYHMMAPNLTQPLTLDGEEITLLKFNLFQTTKDKISDSSDEFMEQEYYLIVGSYKKNATDDNGGMLRFYKFDQAQKTLTKVSEYSGFGKIRDVTYRERCK